MNNTIKICLILSATILTAAATSNAQQTAKRTTKESTKKSAPKQTIITPQRMTPAVKPAPVFTVVKPKDVAPVKLRTPRTEQELHNELHKGEKP